MHQFRCSTLESSWVNTMKNLQCFVLLFNLLPYLFFLWQKTNSVVFPKDSWCGNLSWVPVKVNQKEIHSIFFYYCTYTSEIMQLLHGFWLLWSLFHKEPTKNIIGLRHRNPTKLDLQISNNLYMSPGHLMLFKVNLCTVLVESNYFGIYISQHSLLQPYYYLLFSLTDICKLRICS